MLWEVFSYSFVQKIFSWSFIFPDSLFWCLHSSQINCFTYHSQTGLRKITSVTPAQWCWQPPPTLFPLCGVEGSYRVCLLLLHWVQGWRKLGKDAMSTRKTQPTLCFSSWAHHSCEAGEKGGSSLRTPAHEMRRSTLSLPGIIQKLRHPIALLWVECKEGLCPPWSYRVLSPLSLWCVRSFWSHQSSRSSQQNLVFLEPSWKIWDTRESNN